eukprot:gene3964-4014_t
MYAYPWIASSPREMFWFLPIDWITSHWPYVRSIWFNWQSFNGGVIGGLLALIASGVANAQEKPIKPLTYFADKLLSNIAQEFAIFKAQNFYNHPNSEMTYGLSKRKAETKFSRNVIDPFSVLLEMGAFNVGYETWYTRAVSGWEDLKVGKGVDLVNNSRKIIAEVKNKHNTLKGASQAPLYKELHNAVMLNDSKYKGYTAYYVGVVPKKPNRFSTPFTPSDKETSSRCPENPLIRQIDGASFYALRLWRES